MARSNAVLATQVEGWETVIHTPSTIGKEEGVSAAQTPAILCDWYQGTMFASARDTVIAEISKQFGPPIESRKIPCGMRAYKRAMVFSGGVTLFDENRYTSSCCVVLSGRSEPTRHLRLIAELRNLGVRATRIDLAFDDRRSMLSISDIYQATRSESLVSRWRESSWVERVKNRIGARVGQGVVVGSKTSGAYLSIYDKGLETGSALEGDWIRWELRLSDKQAEEFAETYFKDNLYAGDSDLRQHVASVKDRQSILCSDASEINIFESELPPELLGRFKRLALAELTTRLSFRDRTSSINISRAMLLPWWERFVEYFDSDSKPASTDPNDIPDYDDSCPRLLRAVNRERIAREHVSELLTDIYEEHIAPYKPSIADSIADIPEYGDDSSEPSEDDNDEILRLVGLLPGGSNVVTFPMVRRWAGPYSSEIATTGTAKVIAFTKSGIVCV